MARTTTEEILSHIAENVAWDGDPADVSPTTALFDEGVLDSSALFELISFLEDSYDIEIGDEDILLENFCTITTIAGYVDRKRGAKN